MAMVLAGLLCVLPARSEAAQADLRVGVGMIFDNSVFGGGAAIDIALKDKIKLSPFFEYYKEAGQKLIPFGANLKLSGPLGESKAAFYVGAGLGAVSFDAGGAAGSSTKFLIDALGGIDIPATEKVAIFVEGRYLWGADDTLNDVGAFAGLKFGLGSN